MALREVRMCDFQKTGLDCRSLAESACVLCHKDGCDEHLTYSLVVNFGTTQSSLLACPICSTLRCTQHKPIVSSRAQHALPLCFRCYEFVNSAHVRGIVPFIRTVHASVVEELRAQWAAEALADKKDKG